MSEEIVYPKGTELEHKTFQDFLKSVGVKFSVESWCSLPRKFGRYWPDEVQREWDRRAQPAEQQDEPVAIVNEADDGLFVELIYGTDGNPLRRGDKLYRRPADQAVKLPLRRSWSGIAPWRYRWETNAWNACLDAVAKLNGIEP